MVYSFAQVRYEQPVSEYIIKDCVSGQDVGRADNRDANAPQFLFHRELFLIRMEEDGAIRLCQGIDRLGEIKLCSGIETGPQFLKKKAPTYYEMRIGSYRYQIYDVGLGKGRHYFCLYRNGDTVAMCHKADLEVNDCKFYTLYAEDEEAMLAACFATLFLDTSTYNSAKLSAQKGLGAALNALTGTGNIRSAVVEHTDEALRAKCNESFVRRIQQQDHIFTPSN